MIRLTMEQILKMHAQLIVETGGTPALRDEGLLDSALKAPFQSFSGEEVYPSLQQKAARLCFGLVKNHPFVDGNKRIGAHVMLVFLSLNGIELSYTQNELVYVTLKLASGEIGHDALRQWIRSHQQRNVRSL